MLSLVLYPQLEKFPFPRGSPSTCEDSVGPIYAAVGMQFPVEEKQQAAQDQLLGGSVLDMQSIPSCVAHTRMNVIFT